MNYNLNLQSNLEYMINNKKILLIPIYSMRSYTTNKYNLATDVNDNKIISKL